MLSNSLLRGAGRKVGKVIFAVLVEHYFHRSKHDVEKSDCLKDDDILYHEAFTIIKAILNLATLHTIEDLQGFSRLGLPSLRAVRTFVPLSKCEEAASYLISALGGEEVTKRLIGGVKWWQVRGVNGVDAEWITSEGVSKKDIDGTRCILYLHGGGYYFGSVKQERTSILHHARTINGRAFAINYRLAPQYPFPCGLQDALAAYLFLIRPPPDAGHQAVNPAHIVISGNSAGGGLSLALLQVIRDSGLPLPAGGILISPWCDLSHSFPCIRLNTKTDFVPDAGLSFHKPSLSWPPPSPEISNRVHALIRFGARQAFSMEDSHPLASFSLERDASTSTSGANRSTQPSPDQPRDPQKLVVITESGETIEVNCNEQVHFYTQNSLLSHPLVSPINSYLGGLPPLLFIAGDKEVLRDEIIYCAHKAAYPDRFPITDSARTLYPSLISIEDRYKATSVHLQVYDDSPHVLPVYFSFTTPAEYCFRAIASFSSFVTRIDEKPPRSWRNIFKHALFLQMSRVGSDFRGQPSPMCDSPLKSSVFEGVNTSPRSESATHNNSFSSINVTGQTPPAEPANERTAGDPAVYSDITQHSSWDCNIIRERVSIKGVVRSLESEGELQAFQLQPQYVGQASEESLNRFLKDREKSNRQFSKTFESIEKDRDQNLKQFERDTIKRLSLLRQFLYKSDDEAEIKARKESLMLSSQWGWAWALDEEEDPPPSSIVSRGDTEEARKLAEVSDQTISGNNLWSSVINLLTATPDILHKNAMPGKDKCAQGTISLEENP